MSRGKTKVNFHYGQEDIKKIMKGMVKYKLKEFNVKVNEENKSNNHIVTICSKKAER